MSLQFVFGNSGAGKSKYVYDRLIAQSLAEPQRQFFVVVPEQFTMETQKILATSHPGGGILNIDVLSFDRLAHRIFQEVGGDLAQILEDTGKSLILQKVAQEREKELVYLAGRMKKPGYIDEMKSLLSELMQYRVSPEDLENLRRHAGEETSLLNNKLADVRTLYRGFQDYLQDRYLTAEESLERLCQVMGESRLLRDSTLILDGFTGFTPVQNQAVGRLLALCREVYVTVTLAEGENPYMPEGSHRLFSMSKKTVHTLCRLAKEAGAELKEEIWIRPEGHWRFEQAPALDFLEKQLFRYGRETYPKAQEEIRMFAASTPLAEMEETAVRIASLVRKRGWRYGNIAVVTGDLNTYGSYARQVFARSGIPFFLDEKHTVLMNPFVEYLRASVEVCLQNCSYESMFRYLRCGMSDLTREEVDLLENYVIALGIRGKNRWRETWVRIYPGMEPQEILEINRLREIAVGELLPLLEGWQGRGKTVRSMTKALYEFILKGEIQRKLKEREVAFRAAKEAAMEKEYAQIYGIILDLFDKMVEILGDEPVTLAGYQQLLETGLGQAEVACIPPTGDQVLVGDMERTRLKGIKALFFVGINDGSIPKAASGGGIFSETDRQALKELGVELAPDAREQMGIQRFYLYLNLTKPSSLLTLSYSRSDAKGEPLNPAYLIGSVKKLFPGIVTEEREEGRLSLSRLEHPGTGIGSFLTGLQKLGEQPEEEELWWELYRWYLRDLRFSPLVKRLVQAAFFENPGDRLSEAAAKAVYGEVSPHGATRLERYAACAFAHFLQYGLKLRERKEYEFRALDMGNLLHKGLELFAGGLRREGLSWRELTEEQREALGRAALEEASADYGNTVLSDSARNAYLYRRMERIFLRSLWSLQEQIKRGSFEPEGFEVEFRGGRIDRVDAWETEGKVYVKVIDYKTGSTAFDLVELYHGLQLQLAVYLRGALEVEGKKHPGKEAVPAGIFYYNTKDPLLTVKRRADLEGLAAKLPGELKLNGLLLKDPQVAKGMDATLETVPAKLTKDGAFDARSSVASREQFALLEEYSQEKIQALREGILSGGTDAAPYQLGKKEACTYCPFKGSCGFDKKLPGYGYRKLKAEKKAAVWKAMEQRIREKAGENPETKGGKTV